MLITKTDNKTVVEFESLTDIVDYSKDVKQEYFKEFSKASSRNPTKGFNGVSTTQEAFDIATKGYSDNKIAEMMKDIDLNQLFETVENNYKWDIEGQFFDVGAVVTGEPEHWLNPIKEEKPKKQYTFEYNIGAACGASTDAIINRGFAFVALIDRLQNEGALIDFSVVATFTYKGNPYIVKVNLSNNPIDIDELGFVLAHPAFFRVILFGANERYLEKDGVNSSIHCRNAKTSDSVIYFGFLLDRHIGEFDSPANAVKTLTNQFNRYCEGELNNDN